MAFQRPGGLHASGSATRRAEYGSSPSSSLKQQSHHDSTATRESAHHRIHAEIGGAVLYAANECGREARARHPPEQQVAAGGILEVGGPALFPGGDRRDRLSSRHRNGADPAAARQSAQEQGW